MSALAISDLHLSAKARDVYRFAAMEQVAAFIEQFKINELLILGDLTEEKDFHSAQLVNDVVDIMFSFGQLCEVVVLRGNHDYTDEDCPFFQFLRRFRRVRWINAPQVLQLSVGNCVFLPHTRDYKRDWTLSERVMRSMDKADLIFAHNTFEGAVTEHGKKLSGIPTDVFPKGIPVIAGDIHTPQTLGPVTYVGAPYTVDFGDDYEPRMLYLENGDARFSSVPIPGPQKRLIELSKGYRIDGIEARPGDIVKVRYTLAPDEQDKWPTIKDRIKREFQGLDLDVFLVQPTVVPQTRSVEIKRAQAKSDDRLVAEFGKQLKLSKGTLQVGLDLLKEA